MDWDFVNKLYVSQIVPTIQGEGPSAGVPSLLVRLNGCNCRCPFCDTKYTWSEPYKYPESQIVTEQNFDRFIYILNDKMRDYKIDNLMITGGEPTLYYNNKIFKRFLGSLPGINTIEIETNGTYSYEMIDIMSSSERPIYLNISPKLDQSWYLFKEDFTNLPIKLESLLNQVPENLITFKFVDIPEKREIVETFIKQINISEARMMPWTPDKKLMAVNDFSELYHMRCVDTLKYCMLNGHIYTPRIHIPLFSDETELEATK